MADPLPNPFAGKCLAKLHGVDAPAKGVDFLRFHESRYHQTFL